MKSQNKREHKEWSRREFLRSSGLISLGGLGLFSAGITPEKVFGENHSKNKSKNNPADIARKSPVKSVIFINLAGGASHVDSFDPKPGNGPFRSIGSSMRGAKVTDRLPNTAKVLKHNSLIS